jgi:hypothetical protein
MQGKENSKTMDTPLHSSIPYIKNDPFEGIKVKFLGKLPFGPGPVYLAILLIGYLPLALLSVMEGTFSGNAQIPFLKDFGLQLRFLAAIPLLIFSQPVIRMATGITSLYIHDVLLGKEERERVFLPALDKIRRINDSVISRIIMIAIVALIAVFLYYFTVHSKNLVSVSGWYGSLRDGEFSGSKTFVWYNVVSISIFRFILVRWFWSYCCWIWLLIKVAGCNLRITPNHSDKAGGLNMLVFPQSRFNLFFVALALTSSGKLINDVVYRHVQIDSIKIEALILVSISFIMLLGPYLLFMPKLFRARIDSQVNMSKKSHHLSEEFNRTWIHTDATGAKEHEQPDPSIMIDYYSTYEYSEKIRPFPFSGRNLLSLATPIVLALLPILLTRMSVKELLQIAVRFIM